MRNSKTTVFRSKLRTVVAAVSVLALISTAVVSVQSAQASPGQTVRNLSTSGLSSVDLAQELIGDATQFSNVTYTGDARQLAIFDGFSSIGAGAGVVLTTGYADESSSSAVPGPNRNTQTSGYHYGPGDADLDDLLHTISIDPRPTHDAAALEFDFLARTNTVRFQYIFASEEYPEFVGSTFNDAFGLYINGQNCALVGTNNDPVSINTINTMRNPQFYRDNPVVTSGNSLIDTGFNGMTVPLTCEVAVNKGQVNHAKFVIADVNDYSYDSAVFLPAGSFVTDFSDITGVVYNDADADGVISSSESGIAGVTIALYDSDATVLETAVTDASGAYSFSVAADDSTYFVRPVQVKAAWADGQSMMNAVQTWGAGSVVTGIDGFGNPAQNTATAQCLNGNITSDTGGPCHGAKSALSPDPAVGGVGSTSDPADWLSYTTVTMVVDTVTTADFGFTSRGSYGDAVAGPGSPPDAPGHVNGLTPVVWLGSQLGSYAGPATNGTAHNPTDDGVYIDSYAGKLALTDSVLAGTRTYQLAGDVSGNGLGFVTGWVTGAGNNIWDTTPKWTPTVSGGKAVGGFQFQTTASSGTPTVQLRAQVSTVPLNAPTNVDGDYHSASRWASPGEIEDYSFQVADAVYRPAAVTTGEAGAFTVAGVSLSATSKVSVGPGVAAVADVTADLTAGVPTGWRVLDIKVKDTETGATVASPNFTVSGGLASFTYTPALASDVIVEVSYDRAGDPDRSSLTLDKDATQVATDITATITVNDSSGNPLRDVVVGLAKQSLAVSLSDISCTTDSSGTCSVTLTSLVAGVYPAELSATVVVDAVNVHVGNSPATVTFTPGGFDPRLSQFSVSPAANLADDQTWVVADGVSAYTGTLTAMDSLSNPVEDLDVSQIVFSASGSNIVVSSPVVSHGDGTYTVGFTSRKAQGDSTASVAYAGQPVVDSQGATATRPIPFIPGAPDPDPDCDGSKLTLGSSSAMVNELVTATAFITDANCNPVGAGVTVGFSATGDGIVSAATALSDSDGYAVVTVSDTTAETIDVHAKLGSVDINGSPAAVIFDSGVFDPATSTFTVSPAVDQVDKSTWVTADGKASYAATLTARDSNGNPLSDLELSQILFTTSSPDVVVSAVATGAVAGTYTATFTSQRADSSPTAWVRYANEPVVDSQGLTVTRAIPFKAGLGAEDPDCDPGTKLTADAVSLAVGGVSNITAFITDKYCNPVEGELVSFSLATGSTGVLTVIAAVTDATGKAYATLSDTTAQTVDVHAKLTDDINGSPLAVTFGVGIPHRVESGVMVAPVSQTAGSPVIVTVTVRDGNDNPIDDLAASDFELSGKSAGLPDVVFTKFTPGPNGTYTFETTSQSAGVFTIRASVKSMLVDEAPSVAFVAGDVCVSNCDPIDPSHLTRIEMTVNGQLANGLDLDRARGFAYDTYGNEVPGAVFTVVDATTGVLAGNLAPATQNSPPTGADGVALVSWTSTTAGTFTALTTVRSGQMANGVEVTNSDLHSIRFTTDDASAMKSQLTLVPSSPQKVDASFTLTAKIVDANGIPVSAETVSFATSSGKAPLSDTTCQTGIDGACSVTVTSKFAGEYEVHARVSVSGIPTDLGGDGDSGKASPQMVRFYADVVCVVNCTPLDDPDTHGEDESQTRFTKVVVEPDHAVANGTDRDTIVVHAYDRFGNPVDDAEVRLSTMAAALHLTATLVRTNPAGLTSVDATSMMAGAHGFSVTVAGSTPAGSPPVAHFVAGPVSGVVLTISPMGSQQTGSTYTVSAKVSDDAGNGIDQAEVSFNLPVGLTTTTGATLTSCATSGSGECAIQLTSTKTGSYPVVATIGSKTSNTVDAVFTPGAPDPTMSTAIVTHDGEAFDGVAMNIATITAMDRYGNPVPGVSVSTSPVSGFSAGLAAQSNVAPTDADGMTTIWYTSTQAGAKQAEVRMNTFVIPTGSPVKLNFGSGTGDTDHSSWAITPVTTVTVGTTTTSQFTLTATVRDIFDVEVPGAVVTFDVDMPTTSWGTTPRSCVANAQGVCAVTVTSTTAGTFAFTAALAAGQIGQARSAVWTPDRVCGPCSKATLTTNNSTADGGARNFVTLRAYDQYDNPVPGQLVASTSDDPDLSIQSGIAFTGDDGTTTIWYSSTRAGAHLAAVTVGAGADVPLGSPVTMNFLAGAADPATSVLTVAPSIQTVGRFVTASAAIRDAHNNPVANVSVTFSSAGSSARSANTCLTDINGWCSITITDTVAETISVAASVPVNGQSTPITGSAASVTFTPDGPDPDPTCGPGKTGTDLSVNPGVVEVPGTSTATAHITDKYCNPVGPGVPVGFTLTGNAALSAVTVTTNPAGSAIVTLTGTTPGTVTVTALLGSTPIKGSPAQITFQDTTPPDAPVIVSPKNDELTNQRPIVIAGSGEGGADVDVKASNGDQVCQAKVLADGSWSCSAWLPDGNHTLIAVATDPSGNTSAASAPVTVKVDTVPPNQPTLEVANRHEIAGTAPGLLDPGTTVKVTDAGGNLLCDQVTVADDGAWTCPTPDTVAFDIMIEVVATDPAGNQSDPAQKLLDVTPPNPPLIERANAKDISGAAEANSTVSITYKNNGATTGTVAAQTDSFGDWLVATPLDAIDGDIIGVAKDEAGNVSEPAHGWLDVTPPASPEVDETNGSEVKGMAEPGATVVITFPNGVKVFGCEAVVAGLSGDFFCTPASTIPDGTITVVAMDPAGNESAPVEVVVTGINVEVLYPARHRLEFQTVIANNFNRGEPICLMMDSDPADLGCQDSDEHGRTEFTFAVPEESDIGDHIVTVTGQRSGSASTGFAVEDTELVPTGGTVLVGEAVPPGLVFFVLLLLAGVFAMVYVARPDKATARFGSLTMINGC